MQRRTTSQPRLNVVFEAGMAFGRSTTCWRWPVAGGRSAPRSASAPSRPSSARSGIASGISASRWRRTSAAPAAGPSKAPTSASRCTCSGRASTCAPPQVAVLLTGNGARYEEGAGFYADLERMAKAGWGWGWSRGTAPASARSRTGPGRSAAHPARGLLRLRHLHTRWSELQAGLARAPAAIRSQAAGAATEGTTQTVLSSSDQSTRLPRAGTQEMRSW